MVDFSFIVSLYVSDLFNVTTSTVSVRVMLLPYPSILHTPYGYLPCTVPYEYDIRNEICTETYRTGSPISGLNIIQIYQLVKKIL